MTDLIVHSQHPFNAEPPLDALRASFITPQSQFYIRSHGSIPHLDSAAHRLRITGQVATLLTLSIPDLRHRFPPRSTTAVLQCAGNRRADLCQIRPVPGDPWAAGAIGNAIWSGVALADVLQAAGIPDEPTLHVAFSACDEITMPGEGTFHYGSSIPIDKAMSPDVLLAFDMNGEPLAHAHGFPVRLVVPGYAGVRSVKWLASITVQQAPSDNHMQQRDYKLLPPDVTQDTVDWSQGVTINDMPLNAAICEPAPHAALPLGRTTLRGYAVASSRTITRVEVSCDQGQTWHQAQRHQDPRAPWSWTFWQATLDLTIGEHELVVRAWDSAGQTQPSNPADLWNFKGYLCAAWHRVPVHVG
jgi:sulfite oxidase